MPDVEPPLTADDVAVAPVDPSDPQAQRCLHAYFAELDRRFETGFDAARSIPAVDDDLRPPTGLIMIASVRGEPVGCGALRFHGSEPAELKRMWVAESARGLGVGRRLLSELETQAADHGTRKVRLETNKALVEAIHLYRSTGYVEVDAFNDEFYAHHWFEKDLGG